MESITLSDFTTLPPPSDEPYCSSDPHHQRQPSNLTFETPLTPGQQSTFAPQSEASTTSSPHSSSSPPAGPIPSKSDAAAASHSPFNHPTSLSLPDFSSMLSSEGSFTPSTSADDSATQEHHTTAVAMSEGGGECSSSSSGGDGGSSPKVREPDPVIPIFY
jgi:hypothetical protein